MMKLKVSPNWTKIELSESLTPELKYRVETAIMDICSFNFVEFMRSKTGETTTRENFIPFINNRNEFPTGIIYELVGRLESIVDILDIEATFDYEFKESYEFQLSHPLDQFQLEAFEQCLEDKRGYVKAATGAGKTNIIIALMCTLGGRSLLLVPGVDLGIQHAKDIYEATGIQPSVIQGKKSFFKNEDSPFVVASPMTLWANFEELKEAGWFDQFDNIFLDECQAIGYSESKVQKLIINGKKSFNRIPAHFNSVYHICMACKAPFRFAFSATPKNFRILKAAFGGKIAEIKADDLIEAGRLATPHVYMIKLEHEYKETWEESKEIIFKDTLRNDIILELIKYFQRKELVTLVILDSKTIQLNYLASRVNEHVKITSGDFDPKDREVIYEQMKKGEVKTLISTVVKVGINIPGIEVIIRVAGNMAESKVSQERGRGMRMTEDKDSVIIIDFYDDDGFEPSVDLNKKNRKKGFLKKHSDIRVRIYKSIKKSTLDIVEFKDLYPLLEKQEKI